MMLTRQGFLALEYVWMNSNCLFDIKLSTPKGWNEGDKKKKTTSRGLLYLVIPLNGS